MKRESGMEAIFSEVAAKSHKTDIASGGHEVKRHNQVRKLKNQFPRGFEKAKLRPSFSGGGWV